MLRIDASVTPTMAKTPTLAPWELDLLRSIERVVRLGRVRGIKPGRIELEEGELFEDDGPAAGFSYKPNEERLSDRVWAKKELIVPNPSARKATLLVGPGGVSIFS